MAKTPLGRMDNRWGDLNPFQKFGALVLILFLATGFWIVDTVMGNKLKPKLVLGAAVVAYIVFFMVMAQYFPPLVFIAGIFLGGILAAVFFAVVFGGKRNGNGNHKNH